MDPDQDPAAKPAMKARVIRRLPAPAAPGPTIVVVQAPPPDGLGGIPWDIINRTAGSMPVNVRRTSQAPQAPPPDAFQGVRNIVAGLAREGSEITDRVRKSKHRPW